MQVGPVRFDLEAIGHETCSLWSGCEESGRANARHTAYMDSYSASFYIYQHHFMSYGMISMD